MNAKRVGGLSVALLVGAGALFLTGARSNRATKIAGSAELTYAKQDAIPVAGAEGHILTVGEVRGTNKSTGPTEYFNDAEVVNAEMGDLDRGNGPHQGYYTMTKNGSTVIAKWHGTVTTTMGADQQPQTSFKGTWEYTSGTGEYSSIKGSGTYEGHFLAKDRYMVNWQGQYQK